MTFGEKLQRLRARKGLSQDALAELLDVSRQAVSKWERDETMPEAEKIIRISDCFQVTTDYLLKDGPERFPERGHSLPDPGEVWNKYGFLLGWALAVWAVWCCIRVVPVVFFAGGAGWKAAASIGLYYCLPYLALALSGGVAAHLWRREGGLQRYHVGLALAVWSGLGLVGRCGGLLIGWLSRQAEDIVVTQEEQSAGLVWFVLYGVVLAAGVLLCRRRKEQDP